ncbi:hypothetical protein SFHH103_psfHH103d_540 (plasmid) [Sinorhizobium fredii HH103]|nr:hypothetical protein SFHH103_psfHH103d_540 [Sinorhizobium fredii HH103]
MSALLLLRRSLRSDAIISAMTRDLLGFVILGSTDTFIVTETDDRRAPREA